MKVTTSDGKYTVIQDDFGTLRVLRYDEEWRIETGDNLIYQLASDLGNAQKALKFVDSELARIYQTPHGNNFERIANGIRQEMHHISGHIPPN